MMRGSFNTKLLIRRNRRANGGFTFPEMMVSLAIFVLITAGLYTFVLTSQEHWDTNRVKIQLHQELRKACERMLNDLRQAGPSSIENVPADGVAYPLITFKKAAAITAGALIWEANAITFSRGGTEGVQLLKTQGGNSIILANHISGLTFRRQETSPDILEVTIQGQDFIPKDKEKKRPLESELIFAVQLRN